MMTFTDWLKYGIPFGLGLLVGTGTRHVEPMKLLSLLLAFGVGAFVMALLALIIWMVVCFVKGDTRGPA